MAPPKSFRSDGCTMFPDGPWRACCVEHDRAYWLGGTRKHRKRADIKLMCCVAQQGHPFIGTLMYIGVRLCGWGFWPTPWRWGYGWAWRWGIYEKDGD